MTWSITDDTHRQVIQELEAQTDRGAAIIGAALLDMRLKEAIKTRLISRPGVIEELFKPNAPLGSFSARIDLAYCLGLYGEHSHRDLNLIRKIRNDFAHFEAPLDFTSPSVTNRCAELWLPKSVEINNQPLSPVGARAQYVRAVNILSSYFWQSQ